MSVNIPLVSIIIPAYNHGTYIHQCLDSIIEQTYENIELIILNDGSTDDTHDKIIAYEEQLYKRFKRYVYINKANEGICKTINRGLDLAKGDYIKFFASDDIMASDAINILVLYMEENQGYGMVYADGYNVESDELSQSEVKLNEKQRFSNNMEFKSGDLFEFYMTNVFLMPTPTVLFRKKCFEKVGKFDEELLCEDPDMFIRISMEFQIGCIKKCLFFHRVHEHNSGRNPKIIFPTVEKMIRKYRSMHFDNPRHKEELLETLHRVGGLTNYEKVFNRLKGKRIVGWGTGGSFESAQRNYNFNISYLVDSKEDKHGENIQGLNIYSPLRLLHENKDDIYILVFSQYYKEIYEWLNKEGFIYLVHYY